MKKKNKITTQDFQNLKHYAIAIDQSKKLKAGYIIIEDHIVF